MTQAKQSSQEDEVFFDGTHKEKGEIGASRDARMNQEFAFQRDQCANDGNQDD